MPNCTWISPIASKHYACTEVLKYETLEIGGIGVSIAGGTLAFSGLKEDAMDDAETRESVRVVVTLNRL